LWTSQRGCTLRHPQHPKEEDKSRQDRDEEHVAPHAVVVAPYAEDDRVDREREELPEDDHELVAGDQGAASLVRGDLREVDRHRHRRAADRQPQDEPEEDQHLVVGREDAPHGADKEDDSQQQDVVAPALPVGEPAPDGGAHRGAQKQGGGDRAYAERREAEVPLQGLERAVYDAGVVAEEEPSEGGDHGQDTEAAGVRAGRVRRQSRRSDPAGWW
jgi:hypothetical protein